MHELVDLCATLQLMSSDPRILEKVYINNDIKVYTLGDVYRTSCFVMACAAQAQVLKVLENGNAPELVTLVEGYIDPTNKNPEDIVTGVEIQAVAELLENNQRLQDIILSKVDKNSYLAAYITSIQSSTISP
jgi:hypothetical protein